MILKANNLSANVIIHILGFPGGKRAGWPFSSHPGISSHVTKQDWQLLQYSADTTERWSINYFSRTGMAILTQLSPTHYGGSLIPHWLLYFPTWSKQCISAMQSLPAAFHFLLWLFHFRLLCYACLFLMGVLQFSPSHASNRKTMRRKYIKNVGKSRERSSWKSSISGKPLSSKTKFTFNQFTPFA